MLVCVTIERKKRPINRSRNRLSLSRPSVAYIFYIHFSSMGPINKFSPIRMKKFLFSLPHLFDRFYSLSFSFPDSFSFSVLPLLLISRRTPTSNSSWKIFLPFFKIHILHSWERNPTKSIDNISRFMRTIEIRPLYSMNSMERTALGIGISFFFSTKRRINYSYGLVNRVIEVSKALVRWIFFCFA